LSAIGRSRSAGRTKPKVILFEFFIISTYEITMASSAVICRMQMREEKASATAVQGWCCCTF
jgi:hypothetical protein